MLSRTHVAHFERKPKAAAGWRLITKDIPAQPNHAITAHFVGLLASLGTITWLMPGQGFGAAERPPQRVCATLQSNASQQQAQRPKG